MSEPNFHRQTPMKAVICKNCKGMGSPAPLRMICADCKGRGLLIVEDKPPTKAQLWRKVKRLAGELVFSHACIRIEGGTQPSAAIKSIIANPDWLEFSSKKQRCRDRRIIAKLEAALKAYEECRE